MTDAANRSLGGDSPREVIQRRLIGLAVLLFVFFLLTLLLRSGSTAESLPAVVISLSGDASPGNAPVPVLGQESTAPALDEPNTQKPEARSAPAAAKVAQPAEPAPKPALESVAPKPSVEKPAPPKPIASPKPAAPKPALDKPKAAASSRWYVVVGSYKDPMAAEAIANRVRVSGFKATVLGVTTGGERFNRVRGGPFSSKAEAEAARATLIVEGLTKAVIVGEP